MPRTLSAFCSIYEKSGITATEVAKDTSYIGKYVNYEVPEGGDPEVKWRIFYADGMNGETVAENDRHIYLISDDYLKYDYVPTKTVNGTTYTSDASGLITLPDYPYEVVWGNIQGTLSNQTDLKNALDAKQDELVSGTNIKTINNQSITGSGNIEINSVVWGNITGDISDQTDLQTALFAKANKSSLATVATSGNYNDLIDKPTFNYPGDIVEYPNYAIKTVYGGSRAIFENSGHPGEIIGGIISLDIPTLTWGTYDGINGSYYAYGYNANPDMVEACYKC